MLVLCRESGRALSVSLYCPSKLVTVPKVVFFMNTLAKGIASPDAASITLPDIVYVCASNNEELQPHVSAETIAK